MGPPPSHTDAPDYRALSEDTAQREPEGTKAGNPGGPEPKATLEGRRVRVGSLEEVTLGWAFVDKREHRG